MTRDRHSLSLYLLSLLLLGTTGQALKAEGDVTISESQYEGRAQFKVATPSATWYFDRAGGGFSRLIDRDGSDWIGFGKEPLNRFPDAAAAGFRGIPNLVYGDDNREAGAGHPGFDQCESALVGENVIRTVSKTGRWVWTWTFEGDMARMRMERAPEDSGWWFLYEGTVGGRWSPLTHYWGTDKGGPDRERPDLRGQRFDRWRWAYFGDDRSPRVLFVAQQRPDALPDTFWYLGCEDGGSITSRDGMVVFGLGRGPGTKPLFRGAGQEFILGLVEINVRDQADHDELHGRIEAALKGANRSPAPWDAAPGQQRQGNFWRYHWYERGLTCCTPAFEKRFRVNSPEASLHPVFGRRVEARENGLMQILTEEDLFRVTAAEFYCEAWGGHPGTANKRVSVNGRNTYYLPRVGTEEGHCTYFYPAIPLKLTDLVNGYNAFQFALDQGNTFWGHMLVDNAAVRLALAADHPDLGQLGLAGFGAWVRAEPLPESEGFRLVLDCPAEAVSRIAGVDFQGWYYGYDENGNLQRQDWHGFTKDRKAVAVLGHVAEPPFCLQWDTSLVLAQKAVAVRAVVRFKEDSRLVFLTPATLDLEIEERSGSRVALFAPYDLPDHFWSRAGRLKTCTLDLDLDPSRIETAELQVVTWTGGAGTVKEYFRLNGVHYPIAEGERHELVYSRLPVDPVGLRRGPNRVELLSDTEHHGIEVIYPGPALLVRYRTAY
jgi:hypothetical protein